MPVARSQSGLKDVQNLYVMQFELQKVMQSDFKVPDNRKVARKCLQEFNSLLRQADTQYMGGEDVYKSLVTMQKRASTKLKKATGSTTTKKKVTKKTTRKKVTTKKKIAKNTKKPKTAKKVKRTSKK